MCFSELSALSAMRGGDRCLVPPRHESIFKVGSEATNLEFFRFFNTEVGG